MHMTALNREIRHELTATGLLCVSPHSKDDWNTLVNEAQRQVKGNKNANDGWLITRNGITHYNKQRKLKDEQKFVLIDSKWQSEFVSVEYSSSVGYIRCYFLQVIILKQNLSEERTKQTLVIRESYAAWNVLVFQLVWI